MSGAVTKLLIIFHWPTVLAHQSVLYLLSYTSKSDEQSHVKGMRWHGFLDEWHDHCACTCI
jgi:hypothetical protein